MKTSTLRFCAAFLLVAGASQFAQGQVITNTEIDRGLRFRGTPSFDGESYTQRYSYGVGAGFFYLNGDARQLYYLDYLDRVDRAQKFGYRMPIDPYCEAEPTAEPLPTPPPARIFIGAGFGGFGGWRRR